MSKERRREDEFLEGLENIKRLGFSDQGQAKLVVLWEKYRTSPPNEDVPPKLADKELAKLEFLGWLLDNGKLDRFGTGEWWCLNEVPENPPAPKNTKTSEPTPQEKQFGLYKELFKKGKFTDFPKRLTKVRRKAKYKFKPMCIEPVQDFADSERAKGNRDPFHEFEELTPAADGEQKTAVVDATKIVSKNHVDSVTFPETKTFVEEIKVSYDKLLEKILKDPRAKIASRPGPFFSPEKRLVVEMETENLFYFVSASVENGKQIELLAIAKPYLQYAKSEFCHLEILSTGIVNVGKGTVIYSCFHTALSYSIYPHYAKVRDARASTDVKDDMIKIKELINTYLGSDQNRIFFSAWDW